MWNINSKSSSRLRFLIPFFFSQQRLREKTSLANSHATKKAANPGYCVVCCGRNWWKNVLKFGLKLKYQLLNEALTQQSQSHRWSLQHFSSSLCRSYTGAFCLPIVFALHVCVSLCSCVCVSVLKCVCIAMLCLVPSGRRCWDKAVVFMLSNTPLLYAQIGRSDNSLCK